MPFVVRFRIFGSYSYFRYVSLFSVIYIIWHYNSVMYHARMIARKRAPPHLVANNKAKGKFFNTRLQNKRVFFFIHY